MNTDLTITGKIAQFGRGALADVSDKLLKQFVVNLESTVLADGAGASAGAGAGASAGTGANSGSSVGATPASAPLNLLGSTGLSLALPILKRVVPVLAAIAAIIWFIVR
ncbi:MAG: hypothetical protein ACKOEH_11265 [Actinomycetota bacterium]